MNENFTILIYKTGAKGILSLRVTCDWIEYRQTVKVRKAEGAGFEEKEMAPKILTDDNLIFRIYNELYLPSKRALDSDYKGLNVANPHELTYKKASGRTKINIVDGDFTCDFDLNCEQYADAARKLAFDILQAVQENL